METDELMIVESSSSLHLTASHEDDENEDEPAPALSKLSSSSSASTLEDDESAVVEPSLKKQQAALNSQDSTPTIPDNENADSRNGEMEESSSNTSKEALHDTPSAPVTVETALDGENQASSQLSPRTLEILKTEQQKDGSLHIEVEDDGCGDADESAGQKVQRLARKAGIIVGGGTMTAVGTVMLFLPCPTPSIYLMIGGMAIMSKEIPAAQRQLDTTREGLKSWVDRAEKEFAAGVRTITVSVDSGSPSKKLVVDEEPIKELEKEDSEEEDDDDEMEEDMEKENIPEENLEEPTEVKPILVGSKATIATTQVVHQRRNPVKRHVVKSCRNVIIPLLNKVCTPQEILDQKAAAAVGQEAATTAAETTTEPLKTPTNTEQPVPENDSPVTSPIARWFQHRQKKREEALQAEEQREREAMLARINEANLKRLQQEAAAAAAQVVEENEPEDDEEEEEETPEISESLQKLMMQSESTVIRV